jgi:hypothetical protein
MADQAAISCWILCRHCMILTRRVILVIVSVSFDCLERIRAIKSCRAEMGITRTAKDIDGLTSVVVWQSGLLADDPLGLSLL